MTPSTESCLILQKLKTKFRKLLKKTEGQNIHPEHKIAKGVFGCENNPSNGPRTKLPKRGKDAKKVHVCSDRIKRAEQRLQIGNSFQTLADLKDDDMAISHDIQKPSVKTKIIPILPPPPPPMTNSVIQWNCRGLRPTFDELTILTYYI